MEETVVYQRTSGMHYLVRNPVRETKGNMTVLIPGIEIFFKPRGPRDNRAEFDPIQAAREYVKQEVSAGLIDVLNENGQEKRVQELYQFFCKYVENHADFGLFINRKPGREEIRQQLQNQKRALEQQIASLDDKIASPEPVIEEEEEIIELKEDPSLMTGGGVITGGATMRTARGRPKKTE